VIEDTKGLTEVQRLRAALRDILFLRPGGPTRNTLAMQMENIAREALEPKGAAVSDMPEGAWPDEGVVRRVAEHLRDQYGRHSQTLEFWEGDARAVLVAAAPSPSGADITDADVERAYVAYYTADGHSEQRTRATYTDKDERLFRAALQAFVNGGTK
jgi:hypothetical protein